MHVELPSYELHLEPQIENNAEAYPRNDPSMYRMKHRSRVLSERSDSAPMTLATLAVEFSI